jgi:hypothetical protein
MLAYFLISIPRSKALKSVAIVFTSSIVGVLLSAFWLIPYLEIDLSGKYSLLAESATGAFPSNNLIHWYSLFAPNFVNINAGDLGWILVLPALGSTFFLKTREEFALFGAAVVSIIMTLGPTITPLFYKIPLFLALQFSWRFVIADVLFMAPLAVLFFWRLSRHFSIHEATVQSRRKILALSLILFFLIIPVAVLIASVPPSQPPERQTPSDPGQQEALSFLASQPGFFRVMVVDRYYESFPQFTLKGSIDGWYDQGTTQAYRNFTYNVYYCGASNKILEGLRLLGARYVLFDYGYGGDATRLIKAYDSSGAAFGPPVFENNGVRIYQVPDSNLVYVAGSMPNSEYDFSQGVNCDKPIPAAPANVNYSVSDLNWGETRISFDVDVNQSSYVLLSNSYLEGWVATDNGSSVPILLSPPGLPVIRIAQGTHHIVFLYSSTPTGQVAAILSLGTLLAILTIVLWRRSRDAQGAGISKI